MSDEELNKPVGDALADWILRLRASIFRGIEWLVRFCELVLLAGAFQFASVKTKDPTIGLLAWLLGFAAMFYSVEFTIYLTHKWDLQLSGKRWWRWIIPLAVLGYFAYSAYRGAANIEHAIERLAASNIVG